MIDGEKATLIAAFVFVAAVGQAQTLIERNSQFNYTALYGHGGDEVREQIDSISHSMLIPEDEKSFNFADSISGTYLGSSYTASVSINMMHRYRVIGSMLNFSRIEAELNTSFLAQAGGAAGAGAGGQCTTPGNLLTLDFTTSGFNYEFLGTASHFSGGPTQPHAKAELLKWNGSNWTFLESTIFSNGVVRTGTLTSGTYRLHVQGSTKSILNTPTFAATSLVFKNLSVPEPATISAIALGVTLLMRRRKGTG